MTKRRLTPEDREAFAFDKMLRAILPPRDTLIIDVLNRVISERDEARKQLAVTRADLAIVLDAIDRAAIDKAVK